MCSGMECVTNEAQPVLVQILLDIACALDPTHPDEVLIGPVDFGASLDGEDTE